MPLQIPPINTNYPQAAPPVDPMTRISGMLNIQQQRQGIESTGIDLQAKNQANQERINMQGFMQNPDNWQTDGKIDLDKARPAISKIAPLTGGDAIAKLTTLSKATTEAELAKRDMTTGDRAILATPTAILARQGIQDPKAYISEIDQVAKQYPDNAGIQRMAAAKKTLFGMMPAGPGVAQAALNSSVSLMSPDQENAANSPKSVLIDRGGALVGGVSQPSVAGSTPSIQIPGQAPNAPIVKTLPPTAGTIGPENVPGYVGQAESPVQPMPSAPVPQAAAQLQPDNMAGIDVSKLSAPQIQALATQYPKEFTQALQDFNKRGQAAPSVQGGAPAPQAQQLSAKPAFVPSGLPIGAESGVLGTQAQINKHWSDTQGASNNANQDIAVLGTIKQHAAGAATGIGADRQALAAGIAGLLGMDSGEMVKTNTDLLAKNSNMLALAGGDTNAARAMAEAANPNSHMTKEAITQAADQIIAQRKLALARTQFLTPFKAMADQGHPEMYNNALNQFNSVADPRVIQFGTMSTAEKTAMKHAMSPSEQAEFRTKLGKARQLGIAPMPGEQ